MWIWTLFNSKPSFPSFHLEVVCHLMKNSENMKEKKSSIPKVYTILQLFNSCGASLPECGGATHDQQREYLKTRMTFSPFHGTLQPADLRLSGLLFSEWPTCQIHPSRNFSFSLSALNIIIHLFIHSFINSLIHLYIQSLTHSFNNSNVSKAILFLF